MRAIGGLFDEKKLMAGNLVIVSLSMHSYAIYY
jgi:hypothetical protein